MKKLVTLALAAFLSLACALGAFAEGAVGPPPVPTAEAETYTGPIREYEDKALWFDSTVYGGHYSAYQIIKGNGDERFDADAFINSEMGEKIMSRIRYELCLLGSNQHSSEFMVNYWAENGVIQTAHNADDPDHVWLTFVPDYIKADENAGKVYPVVFSFHGGGGTLFESMNHGFVHTCHKNGYIVVCPRNESSNPIYAAENLVAYLDQMEADGYPIDRTRVYIGGMSQGGMATMYTGLVNSGVVAAIAPHSSGLTLDAAWQAEAHTAGYAFPPLTDELLAATKAAGGMPMYLSIGACDMNQLPMYERMIYGLNRWLATNGCAQAQASADNLIGITADDITVEVIDGAEHTIASFADENGVLMTKIVGVENHPHWVTYSYADMAWDFMRHFSRVDGQLVVTE